MTYRKDSNFVYTDLSSYDTAASRKFYREVFGWTSYDMGALPAEPGDRFSMDQVNYHIATLGDAPTAGIFDMPPFFQKIKMPPFWMSYIAVEGLTDLVERARAIDGVVIDVEPTPFGDGTMALTRDPLGAGFTCYEGPSIDSKGDGSEYGRMVWNELITSSIAKVEHFYREVLGLDVIPDTDFDGTRVKLINQMGEEIAGIQEQPEEIRGPKVYWVPFFSVDSIAAFQARAEAAEGKLISDGGDTGLFYDNTGAAFGVAETGADYADVRPWYRMFF